VKLLQNKIDLGNDSTSLRMEDPVVVKPEVDSKKAFMNDGIVSLKMKGNDPARERMIHPNDTDINPSLFVIVIFAALFEIK
jgi:hypothetical protein